MDVLPEALPQDPAEAPNGGAHFHLAGSEPVAGEGVRALLRDQRGLHLRRYKPHHPAPLGPRLTLLAQLLVMFPIIRRDITLQKRPRG